MPDVCRTRLRAHASTQSIAERDAENRCQVPTRFLGQEKQKIAFDRTAWRNIDLLKGTVSRDFSLLLFFINHFPPSPRKFAEIFASQGAPPVSTTPAAKLPPVLMTPVTNLPPVSTTPAANFSTNFASVVDTARWQIKLPPVSTTPVANNRSNYQTAGNLK